MLQSQVAPALAEDIDRLEYWLTTDMYLEPFYLSAGIDASGGLPRTSREMLTMAEDFRAYAAQPLGEDWKKTLPLVPLAEEEVMDLVLSCQRQNEAAVLRQLAELESMSAGIIRRLELTREIVKEAFAQLKHEHAAQINLTSILCGTRCKYRYQGLLIPTQRPDRFWGSWCGRLDAFNHMLSCYALKRYEATGLDAIEFLVRMARKTLRDNPGKPTPQFLARKRHEVCKDSEMQALP